MRVARIGFTPLKGARHLTHRSVLLSAAGPVGDRAFCLLDPAAGRCLRTIENPALLRSRASWDGVVLTADLPAGTVSAEPAPIGMLREVDYWGRSAAVEVVEGPWAAAYSAHLGREVVLARCDPGQVVYGASVSLFTSASLDRLARTVGEPVDPARLRATFQLDGDPEPGEEESWVGRRLRLGTAEVLVRGVVPRCGVIDLGPDSGLRDLSLLKALAADRGDGTVGFGVDAEVTVPGRVDTGDPAVLVDIGRTRDTTPG